MKGKAMTTADYTIEKNYPEHSSAIAAELNAIEVFNKRGERKYIVTLFAITTDASSYVHHSILTDRHGVDYAMMLDAMAHEDNPSHPDFMINSINPTCANFD